MYSVLYSRSARVSVELNRFPSIEQAIGFASSLFPAVLGTIIIRPVSEDGIVGKDAVATLIHI